MQADYLAHHQQPWHQDYIHIRQEGPHTGLQPHLPALSIAWVGPQSCWPELKAACEGGQLSPSVWGEPRRTTFKEGY